MSLLESQFSSTYRKALESYSEISKSTGVKIHDPKSQEKYLDSVESDYQHFRKTSLSGGRGASMRELKTSHYLEHLSDGAKATLEITNYLGGTYYLTVDEVVVEGDHYLIQQSKNSSNGFMPSIPDIKDGLFKLILFTNLDTLTLNGNAVPFSVRLKLTGQHVNGRIRLPCTPIELRHFFNENRLHCKARQIQLINSLNEEVTSNSKLSVEIGGNI